MLRQKQNSWQFVESIFKLIFLNKKIPILIEISLMFLPKGPINNKPTLVKIMAWFEQR